MKSIRFSVTDGLLIMFLAATSLAHTQTAQHCALATSTVERDVVGDASDDPGPLATGLSTAFKPADIDRALNMVADWQLRVAELHFNSQWTFAAL